MKKNVGNIDKKIRIVIGIILILAGIVTQQYWLSVIGVILLGTAFCHFCPLYKIFGINTCRIKK